MNKDICCKKLVVWIRYEWDVLFLYIHWLGLGGTLACACTTSYYTTWHDMENEEEYPYIH